MREGWTYKKLGEVCEILDSQRKPVTKKDRAKGIYPYYGASGIQDYVDSYIFDGRFLLVGEDGAKWGASDKSAFIIEGKSWVNNHAHILKVSDSINDRLIEYYLVYKDLTEYISGAVVPKLTQKSLVAIPIPVPPIAEQERIVAELDLLSCVIEKKKEQLKAYNQLAQSIFYTMFGDPIDNPKGWETDILENVVSTDCCISYGIVQPGNEIENGIPVVRPVDLVNQIVTRKGLKQIEKRISDDYKRTILKGGELLFCVRGTTGVMSFASDDLKGCNVTRGITPLSFNESINKYYAFYYLKTDGLQAMIADNTRGIALKQINMKDVRALPFLVPPLSLQEEFAEKVEAIERQKALVQQSIEETQTMFDCTMDKYFG